MHDFRQALLDGKRLFFDGAMGTMLQARGLPPGVSPELFCLEKPETVKGVHADYARAGADVLTTNTFGGNRFKLPDGLEAVDFNRRLASLTKEAAVSESSASGRRVFVAGSIGPTGRFLEPLGEITFDELVDVFREQIRGLIQGGVDCLIIETQIDLAESRAAVYASRLEGRIPVGVTMTFEGEASLTGSGPELFAATMSNLGVDFLGANCSAGPREIYQAAASIISASYVPVLIQPNAGLPQLIDGQTVFNLGAEEFSKLTAEFGVLGAQMLGGCCGTTPEHIKALRAAAERIVVQKPFVHEGRIRLSSRTHLVQVGIDLPLACIGERINPTGKKQLSAELQAGEFTQAMKYAEEQIQVGAPILDVNVGAPQVDEVKLLPALSQRLCAQFGQPLCLDSSNVDAIEAALRAYPGSVLVNSISAEHGKLERLGPLCRDLGAPFIFLPLKGSDLPVEAAKRIAIIEDFLQKALEMGIPKHLIIVDVLVLAVSSKPEAARHCLEVVRHCTQVLKLPTVMGLSNISFGLPARELINSNFLSLAAGAGAAACIANPGSPRIREVIAATDLLLSRDPQAERFIHSYSQWTTGGDGRDGPGGGSGGGMGNSGMGGRSATAVTGPQNLSEAVIRGDKEATMRFLEAALDNGEAPYQLVNEQLIPAINQVGEKYERKEYFLPQLLRSAEAMQTAFARVKPLLEETGEQKQRPRIVLATVEGDIHDIGKNIVALMLGNHGFEVFDLGKDVKAEAIVAAAKQHGADIIALSALMTTTMVRMQDTVELLRKEGLSIKVMIGGAVVTEAFARNIGADGYSADAVGAVRLANELLTQRSA